MSQGHGKVRAVAKGVRKTASKFGARLEPTSHIAFQCYRGRELDIVTQVETIDANRALYRMLERALRTLAARPSPAGSTAFFWKLLSLEGFHPVVDECARCGG